MVMNAGRIGNSLTVTNRPTNGTENSSEEGEGNKFNPFDVKEDISIGLGNSGSSNGSSGNSSSPGRGGSSATSTSETSTRAELTVVLGCVTCCSCACIFV